jgi:hypothetical protein
MKTQILMLLSIHFLLRENRFVKGPIQNGDFEKNALFFGELKLHEF